MLRNYLPAIFGLAFSIMLNTGAQAQFGAPDVYVAAGGGGAVLMDTVITEKATGTTFETLPFPGYALTGAVGLDFGLLRLEGEAFYNRYDLDTIKSAGIDLNSSGNFQILAGMANVFVDIPLPVVTPFVGAGIGYAEVKASDLEFGGVPLLNNSGSGLAYQLRARNKTIESYLLCLSERDSASCEYGLYVVYAGHGKHQISLRGALSAP